jgi:hypothetical protein
MHCHSCTLTSAHSHVDSNSRSLTHHTHTHKHTTTIGGQVAPSTFDGRARVDTSVLEYIDQLFVVDASEELSDDITSCLFGSIAHDDVSNASTATDDDTLPTQHPQMNAPISRVRGGGFDALRQITRREIVREMHVAARYSVAGGSGAPHTSHHLAQVQLRWHQVWGVMLDLHDVLFGAHNDDDDDDTDGGTDGDNGISENGGMDRIDSANEGIHGDGDAAEEGSVSVDGGQWLAQAYHLIELLRETLSEMVSVSDLDGVDDVLAVLTSGDTTREWYVRNVTRHHILSFSLTHLARTHAHCFHIAHLCLASPEVRLPAIKCQCSSIGILLTHLHVYVVKCASVSAHTQQTVFSLYRHPFYTCNVIHVRVVYRTGTATCALVSVTLIMDT